MRVRPRSLNEILTTDVLVLGGGPAGSAAALVLADAGSSVMLVRPEHPPGATLAQSIPPSARALLGELGMLPAIESADFTRNHGNTVRWAGGAGRAETFPEGGHGFHVTRGTFEAAVDSVVRAAGVTVIAGATARAADRADGLWRVHCLDPAGQPIDIRATWVVDATGRHGFFARHLGRRTDRRTTTLALVARARGVTDTGATEGHTLIESFEDGWAWSVPVAPGVRCLTAMIDPRDTRIGPGAPASVLASQLRKAPLIRAVADAADEIGEAWACPASIYTSARYTDEGLVLAGDSGAFIDPLSSSGVKKALASGRMAGIVIATATEAPGIAPEALRYHDAHERSVALEYAMRSADYFEEAASRYGHPFWSRRLEAARAPDHAADKAGGPSPLPVATEIAMPPAEVRRAHETLRSAPRLEVRAGPTTRTVTAPALAGRRIAMEDHLVSDAHPRPIRFHRSVDLRKLVELAPRHEDVPDLWSAYNRTEAPVDLPDLITALAAACAAGFLATEET